MARFIWFFTKIKKISSHCLRFLPSVKMTVILEEEKRCERGRLRRPRSHHYHHLMDCHSDRREESLTKITSFSLNKPYPVFSLNGNTFRVLDTAIFRAKLQIPLSLASSYKSKLIPLKKIIKRTFLLSIPFFFSHPPKFPLYLSSHYQLTNPLTKIFLKIIALICETYHNISLIL